MLKEEMVFADDMQVELYGNNGAYPTATYLTLKDTNKVFIRITVEVNDSVALGDTSVRLFASSIDTATPLYSFNKFNPTVTFTRAEHGSLLNERFGLQLNGAGTIGLVGVVIGRITDQDFL